VPLKNLLTALALSLALGCAGSSKLRDRFRKTDCRLPFEERLRLEARAPIIVCGRVLRADAVGQPHTSPGDRRIKTQLTRIEIELEEVIRGNVPDDPLVFYYFTYSADNDRDLGVPRYIPEPGQRRIYFLMRDAGVYRSVGDVTDFTLKMPSGIHRRDFCRGKEPGACMAEMLLTPGEGFEVEAFVARLTVDAYAASILGSPAQVRGLLDRLRTMPDARVAGRAAEVATMQGENDTRPWMER
jgi:hypothetical protein